MFSGMNEASRERKSTGLLLRVSSFVFPAILLIAAVLRFYRLDAQSLWYDEAFSTNIAHYDFLAIAEKVGQETSSPLYYLLEKIAVEVWPSDLGARCISAIAGVVCVFLVYILGNQLFGKKVAAVASFLVAVTPFQVYYSQEARMYTFLGVLELAATLCMLMGLKTRQKLYWLGFVVFTVLALYTHSMAALYLGALVAYYLMWLAIETSRRSSVEKNSDEARTEIVDCSFVGQGKYFLGSLILIFFSFLPWLFVAISQLVRIQSSFWDANFSLLSVLTTTYLFVMNTTLNGGPLAAGLFVFLLVTVLALKDSLKALSTRKSSLELSLVLFILLVPIVLLTVVSFIRPLYLERTLIGSSYAYYLLLGWWLVKAAPRVPGMVAGTSIVLLIGGGLFSWYFVPEYWKPPMREAAGYLTQNASPGDAVLHTSDGSYQPFVWYASGLSQNLAWGDLELVPGKTRYQASVLSLNVEPVDVKAFAGEHSRVWLVVALDHSVDWQLSQKQWFDNNRRLVSEEDFKGVKVLLYEQNMSTKGDG